MADCTAPAFFKVLLDPSVPRLPLPHAFVSKHLGNNIPKNPTLESVTGGYSWRLTIARIDGSYCFAHGWNNVVQDAHLGFGDFLVFRLVHQSTFKVEIFGPNGCVKDMPSSRIKVEDDSDVDDDDSDGIVNESGGEEDEEEDDGHEEEEEEDDDDDDEEEEEAYDDGGGSDGDGGGGDDDDDDGGDIDGNEGDPFFMTTIHNNLLRLPSEFVWLAGIGNKKTITLKNLDDHEWQLGMRSEKQARSLRYYLSSGWPNFRRSNDLSEGDECVFKFLKSEGKLCLVKVSKKKRVARQSPVKVPAAKVVNSKRGRPPAETPAIEVVKRKRGRPFKDRGRVDVKSEDDCVEVVQRRQANSPPQKSVPAAEIPATTTVVKRKRGRPFKDRGRVEVKSEDDCVEVVQRIPANSHSPRQKSQVIYF